MFDSGASSSSTFAQDNDPPAQEELHLHKLQLMAFSDEWYRDFAEDPFDLLAG